MTAAVLAALAALASALASIVAVRHQNRVTEGNERKRRAFERHLPHYERIFVSARSLQDSFRDYRIVSRRVTDRSDLFLRQLLMIVSKSAYDYCYEVHWRHNPGMAYLDLNLESKCLHVRDLLMQWLSHPRITTGDVSSIRVAGVYVRRSLTDVRSLKPGDYQELHIERRVVVQPFTGDPRLLADIDSALTAVIVDLKAVMAF